MPSNSTFRPALKLMSGKAAAFTVTFFIPIVLSRIFTVQEFGTYKQVFLIVGSLYGVAQMGMSECLYYFLPSHPKSGGRFVANSFAMLAVTGAVILAALTLAGGRIAGWLNNPSLSNYTWFAGAYLLLMMSCSALEIVMVTQKRFSWAMLSYAACDVVRGILLVGVAVLTRNLWWVLIAGLVFLVLRFATFLSYVRFEFGSDIGFDVQLFKKQLAYTIPFTFALLIDAIQQNYHQYAVSWYFDAATFAIYAVGCLQIPLPEFLGSPVSSVMMVRIGEELREGRKSHVLPIWRDTCRKLALVFIPTAVLLIVSAHQLITFLFPPQYLASVPIFMLWSLTVVFSVCQTDGMLRVFAQTRFLVVMNLARLATIVVLMSWFLRHFGLIGPVIVTLAGMTVSRFVALARIKMLLGIGVKDLMPWLSLGGIAIVSMLAAVPPALINAYMQMSAGFVLPISVVAYAVAYGGLLLVCGLLSESEKRAIIEAVASCRRLYARA